MFKKSIASHQASVLEQVQCRDIIVKDTDVAKAIAEFISNCVVEKLVVGASPKGGFVK